MEKVFVLFEAYWGTVNFCGVVSTEEKAQKWVAERAGLPVEAFYREEEVK